MSRGIKPTYAEAAEELRRAVACAQTREEFGQALKAFREATTGLTVRAFVRPLPIGKTTVNDCENGLHRFSEQVLRTYLRALDADEELIATCLKHWERTKDLVAAAPNVSRSSWLTDTETGDPSTVSISLDHAVPAPDRLFRRRHIPRWVFTAVGILCTLGGVAVIAITDIGGGAPVGTSSSTATSPVVPANNYWSSYVYSPAYALCMSPLNDRVFMSECDFTNLWNLFQNWWFLVPMTSGKESLIENQGTQGCLDVAATGEVVEGNCDKNVTSQLWRVDTIGSRDRYGRQSISIYNVGKQGYLTMPGGSNTGAVQLIVATYTETGAQRFGVTPRPG